MPGSLPEEKKRAAKILDILTKAYPQAGVHLDFRDAFQLLAATILAAQCTDERVNRITPGLFRKYPTAAAFAGADRTELEQEIRSAGFFRNKAKAIVGAARRIVEEYGGAVPDSMAALVTLPGVARKTANIVLSAGYGIAEGIAVDTHAGRLSRRLGLSRHEDPDKVERDLLAAVPKDDWLDFNFLLVEHGRALCQARKPKCPDCFLRRLCPSAEAFISGGKPK
jgi:endonuclease-3